MHPAIAIIVLTALPDLAAAAPAPAPGAENAVHNPSFEKAVKDGPEGWSPAVWGGKGTHEHAKMGRSGGRSLLLASDEGADISWIATAPLEPFARYRLTGWIRTEGVRPGTGRGALLNLHDFQPLATKAITGTSDWTKVDLEFDAGPRDSVQVNCLLGGWGKSTGKAWFDDMTLEKS